VVATKIDGRTYYMAFLGNEGKLTRFGDVARVADWIVSHPAKGAPAPSLPPTVAAPAKPQPAVQEAAATAPARPVAREQETVATGPASPPVPLPVGVAAPAPDPPPASATP
jgi:D-alanyl-D-alanine carboxypeptidase